MALKVPLRKMCIKKDTLLQKPVSLLPAIILLAYFSRIHLSSERNYKSANTIMFDVMAQGTALFGKATFAMDRGYDDNKMFLKLDELKQDYVIRLKSNRKLLYHNKWTLAVELRNRRKGKVKTNVFYKGKDHEAYLSHVKVQITAYRKNIYLVLVYGIAEHPMMLATNKEIKSKEDVIKVARTYFSRWKIEEYFPAITDWRKASLAYFHMPKRASGSGFGRNVRHTVNFSSS